MRWWILALALVAAAASACSQQEQTAAAASEKLAEGDSTSTAGLPGPVVRVAAKPRRREKPLPAFSGPTLDGGRLSISSLIGKRLLIFFFNPEVRNAPVVTAAVRNVSELRSKHNFEIVGVATGSKRSTVRAFAKQQRIDFPVIDDSSGAITRRLALRSPLAMLGIDSEGYVVFGMGEFPAEGPHVSEMIESQLRASLRLPLASTAAEPVLGSRPKAPNFRAEILDGDQPFDLAARRGEPVVLVFFLHTCPHCHEALRFMKKTLAEIPEDKRPVLVGVEVTGRTYAVRQKLRQEGLDFFPVAFDRDGSIRSAYGVFAGVPDTVLIDAQGRIAARVRGWRAKTDAPLLRMRLAKLSGAPVPMLLRRKGYSGNQVCGICHEEEYETWQFTRHATAFDSLVRHGAETDPECVGCHVVGYDEPGGFQSTALSEDLENVGCESCHQRGGGHLEEDPVETESYEPTCLTCHDAEHSLGFDYATFLPRISHQANAHISDLPLERKRELLAELGRPRQDLLPTAAEYVGSDSCQGCHPAEYRTWLANPHARAVESLARTGEQEEADCLACHTTGFGRPGGFVASGGSGLRSDLARVGCESCHGPGGGHVGEDVPRLGTIVSLGDKCDSCVILQICGGCHDDANDPGFEFEVVEKIERLRHGTIEPGTGRPRETRARLETRADRARSPAGLPPRGSTPAGESG